MVRTCRMCVWFKPLLFPVQEVYRDGYCVKHKCYTRSNDPIAETCEHFVLVGTQESKRSK